MKKSLGLLFVFLMIQNQLLAQELPSIQTDRPDQTECPFIVPLHYFQLENGFSYEKTTNESKQIVAPTILTRFGINDHFELRLITEYVTEEQLSETKSGINPILIGFKTQLFKEKGIIPITSFIGHIGIPKLGSKQLQTIYYAPEFRFTMQHTVSEKQSLSYNLGAEWNGVSPEPTFIYTLTSGYSLSEKMGCYIELYGFVPQIEKPDHRFDAGITYLFNPNHQLDISGGFGLSKISPEYYVALGYSFRFKI
jgi:Putative MetA-pathway of phenol degradation